MSKESLNSDFEYAEDKRKFMLSIMKWSQNLHKPSELVPLDVAEVVILLQCLGFTLQKIEPKSISNGSLESGLLTLDIACVKSGMKAVLTKHLGFCKCPTEEDSAKAQFWSISGCGPSEQERIHVSTSSLLPQVSSSKIKLITDVLGMCMNLITSTDPNENEDSMGVLKNTSALSRHRSLDTLKGTNTSFQLMKQKPSWEMDAIVCAPLQSSSPLPELCNSLNQVSLSSMYSNKIEENLCKIKVLAEQSLEIASGQNLTFIKNTQPVTRASDTRKSPVACNGANKRAFGGSIKRNHPSPINVSLKRTPRIIPNKPRTPNTADGATFVKPRVFRTRATSFGRNSPVSSKGTLERRDTPRPNVFVNSMAVSSSYDNITKSKIPSTSAGGVKTKIRNIEPSPKARKLEEPGFSGISKLKLPTQFTACLKKK